MQRKTSRREALKEMDHLFVDFLGLGHGSRRAVSLGVAGVKEPHGDSARWHAELLFILEEHISHWESLSYVDKKIPFLKCMLIEKKKALKRLYSRKKPTVLQF